MPSLFVGRRQPFRLFPMLGICLLSILVWSLDTAQARQSSRDPIRLTHHGYLPQIRIHEIRLSGPIEVPSPTPGQKILFGGKSFEQIRVPELLHRFASRTTCARLYKLSRRMLVDAVNIFPDMNMEVPIQLTLLAWAETVTVMVEPGGAELSKAGLSVTVEVTPELDMID